MAAVFASLPVGVGAVVPVTLLGYTVDTLLVLVSGLIVGRLGFLAVGYTVGCNCVKILAYPGWRES